jgi:TRAP transporter TAXI family solute receptor
MPAMVAAVVAGSLVGPAPAYSGTETFVSIGTGEINGVYYPVAKAICEVIFRELRAQGIWCSAETTPGSVYNVDGVQSGELELGIVQSDVQFDAYKGSGRWQGRPVLELRSVLSLHPELVTIVARSDANIRTLTDLAGKRVNAGGQGTGTRATWDAIAAGLDQSKPMRLTELRPNETTAALCNGSIDAGLFIVGHPSALISSQLAACPTNLVAITGPIIDKLIGNRPFYTRGFIPAELYGITDKIPSFGGRATLVTSASAEPRVVAAIARAMVTHITELRAAHPALSNLRAEEMVTQSLTAPLHPSAAKVYRDLGLIN